MLALANADVTAHACTCMESLLSRDNCLAASISDLCAATVDDHAPSAPAVFRWSTNPNLDALSPEQDGHDNRPISHCRALSRMPRRLGDEGTRSATYTSKGRRCKGQEAWKAQTPQKS